MDGFDFFFNRYAIIRRADYAKNAGGEWTRGLPAIGSPPDSPADRVACCLQDDARPSRHESQGQRSSRSAVRIFTRADPGVRPKDVVEVAGVRYTVEGPAYDASGQFGSIAGAMWCIDGAAKVT